MSRRRPRHRVAALGLAAAAVSLAGCLQMAARPTATPGPTPVPSPTPPPTATPSPGPPTPSPVPTFTTYTVRTGDNLTTVARQFHTEPRSIAYWNRDRYPSLDPESPKYRPDNLQIGWVLRVLPYGLYTPPPDAVDSGLEVTPAPTEYLGPPTDAPSGSGAPAPGVSGGASAAP
jgi:hypothetical protein